MKLIDFTNLEVLKSELSLHVKGGARDTRTTTTTTTTTATATPATYGENLLVTPAPATTTKKEGNSFVKKSNDLP